jgi:hypothetical protein
MQSADCEPRESKSDSLTLPVGSQPAPCPPICRRAVAVMGSCSADMELLKAVKGVYIRPLPINLHLSRCERKEDCYEHALHESTEKARLHNICWISTRCRSEHTAGARRRASLWAGGQDFSKRASYGSSLGSYGPSFTESWLSHNPNHLPILFAEWSKFSWLPTSP